MEKIQFNCSGVGNLMTEPKLKIDKDNGSLSETAKTYIAERWLRDKYGFNEFTQTIEMKKGILCEQDSLMLAYKVLGGKPRIAFKKMIENDFVRGIPDVILDDVVEDIKTSFTIKTFHNAELTKLYEWQLRCYMWITGLKKARLIYCLVDTPLEIINGLQNKLYYQFEQNVDDPDYQKQLKQIEINHTYSHLPENDRVKVFEVEHSDEKIEQLKLKLEKAIEYYKHIKL